MTPDPRYVLEPVTHVTLREWSNMITAVFMTPAAHETRPFLDIFYPDGITAATRDFAIRSHRKTLDDINEFYFMVRDAAIPSRPAIGGCRWQLHPHARTDFEVAADDRTAAEERAAEAPVEGIRHDHIDVLRDAMAQSRRATVGGRPFMYLKIAAVRPEYQRKGIGNLMVRWGTAKADELGVAAYLESSVVGKGLYLKCGFEDMGDLDFDARFFKGFTDPFQQTAMLREPQAAAFE